MYVRMYYVCMYYVRIYVCMVYVHNKRVELSIKHCFILNFQTVVKMVQWRVPVIGVNAISVVW